LSPNNNAQGRGVKRDNVTGYTWLNVSVLKGYDGAKCYRDKLHRLLLPEQIKKAHNASLSFVSKGTPINVKETSTENS
jgi:hypothetical protein